MLHMSHRCLSYKTTKGVVFFTSLFNIQFRALCLAELFLLCMVMQGAIHKTLQELDYATSTYDFLVGFPYFDTMRLGIDMGFELDLLDIVEELCCRLEQINCCNKIKK